MSNSCTVTNSPLLRFILHSGMRMSRNFFYILESKCRKTPDVRYEVALHQEFFMYAPMISIIMPVYNAEAFIEKTISSIQKQTYSDFELICVDDGSTDCTPKIIKSYISKDPRISDIEIEHNGAGQARNIGIDHARGRYLIFLDCDDEFDERLLELALAQAKRDSADIVCFDATYIDNNTGLEMPSDHVVCKKRIPQKKVFSGDDCPETLLTIFFNVVWTKFYSKEFIDKYHIRFENREYMNDVYFHHVALLQAKRICYLDKKLVRYQQNRPGNHSNADTYSKSPSLTCDVTNEVRNYILKHGMNKRLLLGLLENELFRMKGVLESQDECHFHEIYRVFRNELSRDLLMDELNNCEWVDKELFQWGKRLVELEEKDFLSYLYQNFKNKYWQHFYLLEKEKKERAELVSETEFLIKNKRWCYDENVLTKGERVVVHGAGEVGKDYVAQIKREGKVFLVGWVDKNYMNFKPECGIESPDSLLTKSFDKIIIAIRNEILANKVKESYMSYVTPDRILLMTDMQEGLKQ